MAVAQTACCVDRAQATVAYTARRYDAGGDVVVVRCRAGDRGCALRGSPLLRMLPLQQDPAHVGHGELQRLMRDETDHAQVRRAGQSKYDSFAFAH